MKIPIKADKLALLLSLINLILLVIFISPVRSFFAQEAGESIPAVVRARALEIVDERGRVRAQILITKEQTVDGITYPEGTLFRLIDAEGSPNVKIDADRSGAGLLLSGADPAPNGWYGIQILSRNGRSVFRIADKDGTETEMNPSGEIRR